MIIRRLRLRRLRGLVGPVRVEPRRLEPGATRLSLRPPRMVVDGRCGQVDFLRKSSDATVDVVSGRGGGGSSVELRIGDSIVMVSSSVERATVPCLL
jgi:hypothetical protein